MVDEADVRRALEGVDDPGGGNIVAAGRVRSLVLDGSRVGFALATAADERAAVERARQAAEAAVAQLPGVERVLAAMVDEADAPPPAASRTSARPAPAAPQTTASPHKGGLLGRAKAAAERLTGRGEPPASPRPAAPDPAPASRPPSMPLQGEARRRPASPAAPRRQPAKTGPIEGVARIVAVGSGKGGVGKSTVSINLAVALAGLGERVGLLDADIHGPSVPTLIDAVGTKPTVKEGLQPIEAYGIRAMSIGFLVNPREAVVWRGPMVTGALSQLMRDTRWGQLDWLIIDMPPGTGDIQLSLSQQTPLAGAVIVTTPQDLALIDVRKAAAMFDTVNVPLLGVVENMATFVCPHCGEATDIFGHGGGEREAAARDVPFLGRIPLTLGIREASDAGHPVASDPSRPEAAAYQEVAANLMAAAARVPVRPFPKIVFED